MRKYVLFTNIFMFVAALSFHPATARFPIKIPKLPKVEKPKPEQPLTLIPVKVLGTTEKWNPSSWKTGMF